MIRVCSVLSFLSVLLSLGGCSQLQTQTCIREMVNRNEPYLTRADRDDTEALAAQLCRQKASGKGS